MAATAQAESLPPGFEPPVPEAFRGPMDGKTIPNFIHQFELYFSLVSISSRYMQALFTVRLLQGLAYTWFITQQYVLDRNSPATLDWHN